jgi:hypothetical protein
MAHLATVVFEDYPVMSHDPTPGAASHDEPELEATLVDSTLPTHRDSNSDSAVGRGQRARIVVSSLYY